MSSKLALYTPSFCLAHDTGPGHPESPARLAVLNDLFSESPFSEIPRPAAPEAPLSWIYRAHDKNYVTTLSDATPDEGYHFIDTDTALSPGSWDAALHAAGAVCQAVADMAAGTYDRAFCAIRPPGHHAFPDHAEGFCLFNNAAVGALHARDEYGLERVAILDFDVHHGNGTDAIARLHPSLCYASTHQAGIYPDTGIATDDIENRIINRPLPAGTEGPAFHAAWDEILTALDRFKPDLIMISAGFDAHKDDALAAFNLEDDDFITLTRAIIARANTLCQGRVISVLEGGYNLKVLKRCVGDHLKILAK